MNIIFTFAGKRNSDGRVLPIKFSYRHVSGKHTMTHQIEHLLSLKQVREIVPYSPMQIYRLQKTGEFPQRLKIGKHRVAWRASDIKDWIESKSKQRRAL